MKKIGLYIRVSTDRQAKIEEGSLTNQDHLLTQNVEFRNKLGQQRWVIVDRYVDEGKSAKNTNRPQYQRLLEDISAKKINAVMCLALSRISRSTKDLLEMVEFFKAEGVDFICLKEDFDTTTPQGKCFLTIMGALNEFEREQTGDRTRAAFYARGQRGLWNGGHLYGYDLNQDKKGHLIPNDQESTIVNEIFDVYIETGSSAKTTEIINRRGYTSKSYQSRRGVMKPSAPFSRGAIHKILTNLAYVGMREVNKMNKAKKQDNLKDEQRYQLVEAVWPAILSEEKFYKAQEIMNSNRFVCNNMTAPARHFYLFNGGLLKCADCGSPMEGRSAHGRNSKVYRYYYCMQRECQFRISELELEKSAALLLERIAASEEMLPKVVDKLNEKLRKELPEIKLKVRKYEMELAQINSEADTILSKRSFMEEGAIFFEERIKKLTSKRSEIESVLARVSSTVTVVESRVVRTDEVKQMLSQSRQVFGASRAPYLRTKLLKKVAKHFEVSDNMLQVLLDIGPRIEPPEWPTRADALESSRRGAIIKKDPFWGPFLLCELPA